MTSIWPELKAKAWNLFNANQLLDKRITIQSRPLSTKEAIGDPEQKDYPLQKGRERLMQAEFGGFAGQAYTDQFGDYEGTLQEITEMELSDNLQRAIFVSTLNAVLRYLGHIEGTIHCRDTEPAKCADKLKEFIASNWQAPKITIIGFQPRFIQILSNNFPARAVDMDPDNIGEIFFDLQIEGPDNTEEAVNWADLLLITGTTLVNDTIGEFLKYNKPKIFYGTTIAGAAWLMDWTRFCSMSG